MSRYFKKSIPLFFLLTMCSPAFSQTQAEMNQQAEGSYRQADAALNEAYKRLTSILSAHEKALLVQAEKDWIKFRDSHCSFEASQYEGGSMQPLIYYSCLEGLTRQRTAQLKEAYEERTNK